MSIRRFLPAIPIACCAVAAAFADLPDAEPSRDFLRRPALSGYRNYGEDLYRPYRREIRLVNRFDYLGNYLAEGFPVYELDERGTTRRGSRRSPASRRRSPRGGGR